jgi:hypothetical protein
MELRPLGFGEIFDRAVTLYIRNFVPFAAIVVVLVVPVAILQYVIDRAAGSQLETLIRAITHPGQMGNNSTLTTLFATPASAVATILTILLTYIAGPFVMNAVAVGVARLYRGRPVEFRACYEAVFRRWSQVMGLLFVEFGVFLGWYVATVVAAILVVLLATLLGSLVAPLAVVFGILAIVVVLCVMLPLLAPLVVALGFAMYAVVIEERGVIESLVSGFTRVFNRTEFWRALLFAIAAGAIVFGASTMFGAVALLAAYIHLPIVEAIVQAIPNAVISPFAVVLFAIYYFDVRIRREAYDLETSLERLTASQPA